MKAVLCRTICAVIAGAALALLVRQAPAQDDESSAEAVRDLFRQGHGELGVGAGFAATNVNSYLLLELAGGYYMRDGLSLGAAGEAWLGSQPEIYDVSPYARYVFLNSSWRYKPYVGAFYRRTFFNRAYSPESSAGARAGFMFPLSDRAYLTGGLAYESYFNCNANSYFVCNQVYPEIGLVFGL